MSDENIKTDEIKRLTTPLTYKNSKAFDCNGKLINCVETLYDVRYIVEPKEGVLSDDEILQYAPQSRKASEVRLKRGIHDISDILLIHETLPQIIGLIYVILICVTVPVVLNGNRYVMLVLLIVYIIPLIYLYLIFNSKKQIAGKSDTTSKNTVNNQINDDDCVESLKVYKKEIDDLKVLFEVKEDVVRRLIEKKFEPPQITYDKFISLIDTSQKLFNIQAASALNIIDLAVEDTPRIQSELQNKIEIMKSIIDEIEKLTNELVLNINDNDDTQQEVKNLLDDMEKLINSVKEY